MKPRLFLIPYPFNRKAAPGFRGTASRKGETWEEPVARFVIAVEGDYIPRFRDVLGLFQETSQFDRSRWNCERLLRTYATERFISRATSFGSFPSIISFANIAYSVLP